MADIDKIKRNVKRMVDGGAAEGEIDAYLSSEGVSAADLRNSNSGGALKYIDDVARRIASGATFGFADEFAAGMNAAIGRGDYSTNVAQERARDAAFYESNPKTALAAEIGGAVVSPINKAIGAVAGPGALNLGKWANYAFQGGAGGAIAGAGNATEGNRLSGSLMGAGAGAALGLAVPGAMTLGTNAAQRLVGGLKAPESPMARALNRAMERDGLDVGQVRSRLAELGPEATIADMGGNVTGLARSVAQMPGQSMKAAEALRTRQGGQGDRLMKAALDAVGVDSLETLIQQRSAAARPLYDAAFAVQQGPATTLSKQIKSDKITRLLDNPLVQSGINKGIAIIRNEADALNEPMVLADYALQRNAAGQFERVGTPTLRLLDAAKRGLDDIMQSDVVRDPVTNRLTQYGRSVEQLRSALVGELDNLTTDPTTGTSLYKQAREAWAGPSDAIEALATIKKTVERARDFSDVTGRLLGSKEIREKLSKLLPTPEAFNAFAAAVQREKTFAETNRFVLGNSLTQFTKAAQDDLAESGTDAAFRFAERSQGGAMQLLLDLARSGVNALKRPPTQVADELAQPLFSSDPVAQKAAFDELAKRTKLGSILARPNVARLGQLMTPQQRALMTGSQAGAYAGGLYGGSNQ